MEQVETMSPRSTHAQAGSDSDSTASANSPPVRAVINAENRLNARIIRLENAVEARMSNMEAGMSNMEARMNNMETRLSNMETRMSNIEEMLRAILAKI